MLPAAQHLAADIIYFFPEVLPVVEPMHDGTYSLLTATGYPPHYGYRHGARHPNLELLARWINLRDDRDGRILVQGGMEGEALAWMTDAEILGGFPLTNLEQAYANLFRLHQDGDVDRATLHRYLESYAVRWVVISSPRIWFDDKPDLIKLAARFAQYRIYRVQMQPSFFQRGAGEVRASTNRIAVSGTDPGQTLELRYHWLETLVCEPGCRLERADNPWGGADFIRIPAPHPRDLVIRNAY
jgi:hypothetical protein